MKLVNPDFYFPIEFHENEVITIIMESPDDMNRFAVELLEQCNGGDLKWILSNDGDILHIEKKLDIIMNPFSLDLNQRKMITKLYDQMQAIVESSNLLLEWNKIYPEICSFTEKLLSETDYQLQYHDSIELKELFKFIDLKFTEDGSFLGRIIDYITLMNKVLGVQIFMFFQVKSFLRPEELELLFKQAAYQKIYLILIEPTERQKSQFEKIYLIDKDHCVIYNK